MRVVLAQVIAAIVLLTSSAVSNAEALRQNGASRWIVIAARGSLDEAVTLAQYYANVLPVRVVRSQNGWFAVVAGPERAPDLDAMKARYGLPSDALLSQGERYVETVWAPAKSLGAKELFQIAERAFLSQTVDARIQLQQLLAAAGYWPAVSNEDFGRRLYDAIAKFQRENGFQQNGVVSQDQRERLRTLADPALSAWRLTAVAHPTTGKILWAPQGFDLTTSTENYGLLMRSSKASVMYAYFPNAEFNSAVTRISTLIPNQVTDYKVVKPDFFVIAAHTDTASSYSRYHVYGTGLLGFTLIWNNQSDAYGDRLSTVMSDLFRATVSLGKNWSPPVASGSYQISSSSALSYQAATYPQPSLPAAPVPQGAAIQAAIDADIAKAERIKKLRAQLATAQTYYETTIALNLPAVLHDAIAKNAVDLAVKGKEGDEDRLRAQAAEYEALKAKIDASQAITAATTAKNAFVMSGAGGDLLLLYNDTGKAPSVVKDIRGDLVFEAGRARFCQAGDGPIEEPVLRVVNSRLEQWGLTLRPPLNVCNANDLKSYDVVVLPRSAFQKLRSSDIVQILTAVDASSLQAMLTVTQEEALTSSAADAARSTEIERAVDEGGKTGFGFVMLKTGSPTVCQIVAAEAEAHLAASRPFVRQLEQDLGKVPAFSATTADAAFVSAKRGQCGAIYGTSPDLKVVSAALRRDGVPFRFLPSWIEQAAIEGAGKTIADARARELESQARAEADARRARADADRLQAIKDQEASVVRDRRQAELRQENGPLARALEDRLTSELKELLEGAQNPRAAGKYPDIARWFGDQMRDQWELMAAETTLIDYGMSDFKGRSLDTGFARTEIKMRNRLLGEYRTTCFVTGFIHDHEFSMEREPVSAPCDTAEDLITEYKKGERFTSRWIAP
jgi:hypothetical protein